MNTVLSHIVQKRFSQENENIATDALAFIVHSSETARGGLMKLLRGLTPELPSLQFRTQQSERGSRPDMWGYDVTTPRVFIENKFWAGLTGNQPVEYLRLLAEYPKPTVLLVVVPAGRQETVWRELLRRLSDANVCTSHREPSAGTSRVVEIDVGRLLALTSWAKLLSAIEAELTDGSQSMNDLLQLRALCDAADSDAFVPISSTELTNQRTPAFVLQLNLIVQRAVDLGITQGVLSIEGLRQCHHGSESGDTYHSPQQKGSALGLERISSGGDGTVEHLFGCDFRQRSLGVRLKSARSWSRGRAVRELRMQRIMGRWLWASTWLPARKWISWQNLSWTV